MGTHIIKIFNQIQNASKVFPEDRWNFSSSRNELWYVGWQTLNQKLLTDFCCQSQWGLENWFTVPPKTTKNAGKTYEKKRSL